MQANGKLYGSPEYSTDELPILDPVTNTVTSFHARCATQRCRYRSATGTPRP
jgi:hypothetical protein